MAKAKVNYRKLTMDAMNEVGVGFKEGTPEFEAAVKYVTDHWELAQDPATAKSMGMSPKTYALNSVGNGILDGDHEAYLPAAEDEPDEPKGQPIVEVDQDKVKQALRTLVTRENDFLAYLYDMHAAYNEKYFFGQLSHPFITIDKLSNKTLGNYTHGEDSMGITNHIRFNRNFIALNRGENGDDPTRILETLRHEMIHQWQDEVLYMSQGVAAKEVMMPVGFGKYLDKSEPAKVKWDKKGKPVGEKVAQLKRPKNWHNRDFKEYAVVVDIPAIGDKCYGNPANMPKGESYNRKFTCGCIASNGSPLTIWSTRDIKAHCILCDQDYIEQKKAGGTIKVVLSNIEAPGEDAIRNKMMNKGYTHFEKFASKKDQLAFVDKIYAADTKGEGLEVEQGFYLKGNNAYKEGFTHWVAYKGEEVKNSTKKPNSKKKLVMTPSGTLEKVENPVELPKEEPKVEKPVELPKEKKQKAAPKAKTPTPKKKPEPKVEVPVELPKKEQKPKKEKSKVIPMPTTKGERTYQNADDLIAVYRETGSIKGVAEVFGVTSANIIYWAKKLGVDFKKGAEKDVVKS